MACLAGLIYTSTASAADDSAATKQPNESNTHPPTVVSAMLHSSPANGFECVVNLGEFEPGDQREFRLKLQSSGNFNIAFDDLVSNCGCVKPMAKEGEIKTGTTFALGLKLEVPSSPTQITSASYIRATLGGMPQFTLIFKYTLKHAIIFPASMAVYELSSQKSPYVFSIPFKHNHDLSKDVILIDWSNNVRQFMNSSVELSNDRFRFSLDPSNLSLPTSALLTVTCGTNPFQCSIPVVFNKVNPVSVRPSIIRVVASQEKSANGVGVVIIRYNGNTNDKTSMSLQATFHGSVLPVELSKVNESVWKARLFFSEVAIRRFNEFREADADMNPVCKVHLVCNGDTSDVEMAVVLP